MKKEISMGDKPDKSKLVPKNIIDKWQQIVNLTAEIVGVPAALIMRVEPPYITVFVSSESEGNPYKRGEKASLNTGLYCETVMATRDKLLVPDARKDKVWAHNPDIKLGMVSYLGFPLIWPDGEIFGTICVLDLKENPYNALYINLMRQFKEEVEGDLRFLFEHDQHLQTLREERDRVQMYLDIAGVIFVAINAEQRVALINKKGCEVLGYDEKEIIGKNWFDNFLPERVMNKVRAVFEKLMAGEIEPVEYFENPVLTKRGDERIIAWHNTVLRDETGKIISALSSGEDITERKRMEKLLEDSEKKYRNLVDNAPVGIYKTNLKGDILYINEALANMFEFESPEEIMRSSALARYKNKKDREVLIENLERTGKVSNFEIEMLTKTGKTKNMLVSAVLDGDILSGMLMDITEHKRAEELLKEHEMFLSSVLEGIGDGVIVIDRDFKIISANSGYLKQTKSTLDGIIGKHCYEVSHHSMKPCYLAGEECSARNAFETGVSHRIIHTHFDKDNNPIYVETISYPLKDPSGNVISVVEIIADVTEKVGLDKELQERIKELEEFYDMAVGRELKMIELRDEIKRLKEELGKYKT